MRVLRFSPLLLAMAVLVLAGSLRADSFVQWGSETVEVTASRGLSWKKPKTDSGVVTANRVSDVDRPIRQVQFQEALPTVTPPGRASNEPFPLMNSQKQAIPTPTLPTTPSLQTPLGTELVPETGPMPAPEPLDSGSLLSPPAWRGSREIECPDSTAFKSIREISYDITPKPGTLPRECPLIASAYTGRSYSRTCFFWTASGVCTKGAYFENVQLERYGHSLCPALEPIFSGVRFFVTIPLLPYKLGLTPPNECVYTLGHYRVGNCAPYMLDPLPISVRAILFQTAAVGGAVAIIP